MKIEAKLIKIELVSRATKLVSFSCTSGCGLQPSGTPSSGPTSDRCHPTKRPEVDRRRECQTTFGWCAIRLGH